MKYTLAARYGVAAAAAIIPGTQLCSFKDTKRPIVNMSYEGETDSIVRQ